MVLDVVLGGSPFWIQSRSLNDLSAVSVRVEVGLVVKCGQERVSGGILARSVHSPEHRLEQCLQDMREQKFDSFRFECLGRSLLLLFELSFTLDGFLLDDGRDIAGIT